MSGAVMRQAGLPVQRDRGALRGWMQLHAWGVRRRRGVFVTVAVLTAAVAFEVCIEWDVAGLRAAESGLADIERTLAEAQRTVARLPALKEAAASKGALRNSTGSAAEDIHRVSRLTAATGLALLSLEPSASGGTGAESFRALRLAAQGDFAQLGSFLAGLSAASGLIVPTEVAIKRNVESLSIAATLQVFDGLPPVSVAELPGEDDEGEVLDPFASRFGGVASEGSQRLAGVIQDRSSIVALIEAASGTEAIQAGQAFGGGRVVQVAPSRVVLSSGPTNQTLTWAREAK